LSTILSYITSARLGDGSWKNETHAFILNWQDQFRKYETIDPVAGHFSEGPKKAMLQNAVYNIADLCADNRWLNTRPIQGLTSLPFNIATFCY